MIKKHIFMKGLVIACLSVILSITMVFPRLTVQAMSYEKGETLYTYNASTAASDWHVFSRGSWTFGNDGISVENNDQRTGDDAWYYAYMGANNGWTDYVIECDMENVTECAILFRITDPTDNTVDAFGGYSCGYDSSFMFMGKDQNDKWLTLAEGGEDASAQYPSGYTPNMHWTLYVHGNTYTLYVDHAKFATMQCIDKDNSYPSGGIGVRFRTYKDDDSGKIKNLTVSKLKVQEPNNSNGGENNNTPNGGQSGNPNNNQDPAQQTPNDPMNGENQDPNSDNNNTDNNGKKTSGNMPGDKKNDATGDKKDGDEEIVEVYSVKTEIPVWFIVTVCVIGAAIIAIPVVFAVILHRDKKKMNVDKDEK